MIKQRDSREMALKFLFCQEFLTDDSKNLSNKEQLTKFQHSFKAQAQVWEFTSTIIESFHSNKVEIDSKIADYLVNWNLDRLSLTDRNILRIALTEMIHLETPPKVALNEAVDLGKKYSTKESAAFINGVLDKVLNTECS